MLRRALMLRSMREPLMSLMPLVSAQRPRRKPEPYAALSLIAATLIVGGICGVAQADVYRWVDDHGEAHYTDRWVPGSELIKSSKPHPGGETAPAPSVQAKSSSSNSNQAAAAAKQQQAAEAAVKQDVAKTKEAQCKQAKERYQKAIEARRLYKTSADGKASEDRVYMSDEEADKYRLEARNDVTLTCGGPPAPPAAE